MEKDRIYLFDTAKFILIFFVIFGHMMENVRDLSYNSELYGCIYLFHMPLFIFISGFFSKKYQDKKKFWMSELRLVETLLLFHVASILFKMFVYGKSVALNDIVIPGFGSWYLLSLIYWRTMLQFAPKSWLDSKWMIPACVAISLLGGFVPIGGAFSIQRTFTFLPFFVLGYLTKERNWLERIRINPWCASIVLIVVFCNIFIISNLVGGGNEFHSVMMGTYTYFKGSDFISHPLLYRTIFLALSAITCCAVLSVVPTKHIPVLTDNGKDTLFFYVYHAFVFRLVLLLYPMWSIEKNSLNLFIGAIIVMLILMLLSKIPFLHFILNPFTAKLK